MGIKNPFSAYRGLPKDIYIVFVARIVNSIGNFVMPLLTILLTGMLKYSESHAGKFVMVAAFFLAVGSMIGGKLCDRFGRKKTLILFQGLAAISLIPCAFPQAIGAVPYFMISSAFFGGAAGPCHTAIATDLTDQDNRKAAFSLLYLGNNIGFAIGPMMAGILYKDHLPWIFIGDAVTTLVSLALVWFCIRETMPHKGDMKYIKSNEKAEEGNLFCVLMKRPVLLIFSIIMIIYSFIYVQSNFSLPIQVNSIYNDYGPKYFGFLMTANALTVIFMAPLVTKITLRHNPIVSIIIGGLQYAAGFGMIYFIRSMPMLVLSTVIWTVGEVLITTNSGVYIANNTPISHRGRINAILPILTGAGYAFGPALTGRFMERQGVRNVWILCIILSLAASGAMVWLRRFDHKYSKKEQDTEITGGCI